MKWSVQYLSKRSFLNDYHSWSCGIFYLLYVLGGSSACTESKIVHTPYLIHFGFWTSCQDANTHVALILWASPREEGNNQLEHMARSNECSHKTHIIIYIYISLEWLLSKGIVLTFTACIKLNVNKEKRHTKSSPAPQFLRPSIFNVAVVLPCRKVDTTLLASMKTREKIPCREDDSIFHAYSTQPKNLP